MVWLPRKLMAATAHESAVKMLLCKWLAVSFAAAALIIMLPARSDGAQGGAETASVEAGGNKPAADEADAADPVEPIAEADKPPRIVEPDSEPATGDVPAVGERPKTGEAGESSEAGEDRDPFRVSARLLAEVRRAAAADQPLAIPEPTGVKLSLPDIRMTGVMIVGEKKMATAHVGASGTVTLVQGEPVLLPANKQGERVQITVLEIGERYLTIQTGDGNVVRAQFK